MDYKWVSCDKWQGKAQLDFNTRKITKLFIAFTPSVDLWVNKCLDYLVHNTKEYIQ